MEVQRAMLRKIGIWKFERDIAHRHLRTHLKGDRRQLRRDHNQFGAKTVNIRKYCVQS